MRNRVVLAGWMLCLGLLPMTGSPGAPVRAAPSAWAMASRPLDLAGLRALRRKAAHRRRRIIFNNDGDDVCYGKKAPTPGALLALRTTPLLGSQVDSIFYSNSMCFGQALHGSKVFEPFTCTEGIFADNGLPQLLARSIDPIRVMADFGHRHGIEVFWDMRMNDTHDAEIGGYGPYLRPKLKRDHPEYLVGSETRQPPNGPWSSVDYAVPQVRELAYRFFEEVCRKFDVDGIELDFLRHACFFKSVAWGGRATQQERDLMTDLIRRTRRMTEREGLRRRRPILIAIRVPDSVDYCRATGLDVERWLREGLVDILSGSCYSQLNRWEYLVRLGHRYGVPVYPSLSESRVEGETRFSRNSLQSYRARAIQAWAAGADGIYMFNYFDPRRPLWREVGDPAALRRLDKLYFVTPRNGSPDSYLAGGREFQHVPVLTPGNPLQLSAGEPVALDLPVGDDLDWAGRAGLKPQAVCHVRTLGVGRLSVALNGVRLGKPAVSGQWQDFPVPPSAVRRGTNRFAASLAAAGPQAGSEEWTYTYDGRKLPETPWQKDGFYTPTGCVAEVQDGRLLIADRGTESGCYAYFRCPCAVPPGEETVIEARLKVLSGWSSVCVENGEAGEEFQFYPDRVQGRYSGVAYAVGTTDAFHTYRIVLKGKSYRVYVDGVLRLDGTDRMAQPAWNGRSGVAFGAANSNSLGEALWESVRIRSHAGTVLDVALSVNYPGAKGRAGK